MMSSDWTMTLDARWWRPSICPIRGPCIAPRILGGVLATIAFPMFRRVRARLHDSDAKAGLVMIVLITVGVILPVLAIIMLLVQQANTVVQEMRSGEVARTLQRM